MERQLEASLLNKKEIGKYIHILIARGDLQEAEEFLLQYLEAGDRTTIILGSLINVYKIQGNKWAEIEELAREYLQLKPGNSFAEKELALALKMQGKSRCRKGRKDKSKTKEKAKDTTIKKDNTTKSKIKDFRKKIYNSNFSIENISDEQLAEQLSELTEFEQTMLLVELYSHLNLPTKVKQLLKQAKTIEGISQKERKIIAQAMQLVNSKRITPIKKKIQWDYLIDGKERD